MFYERYDYFKAVTLSHSLVKYGPGYVFQNHVLTFVSCHAIVVRKSASATWLQCCMLTGELKMYMNQQVQ